MTFSGKAHSIKRHSVPKDGSRRRQRPSRRTVRLWFQERGRTVAEGRASQSSRRLGKSAGFAIAIDAVDGSRTGVGSKGSAPFQRRKAALDAA
jgi:hypothetical protein